MANKKYKRKKPQSGNRRNHEFKLGEDGEQYDVHKLRHYLLQALAELEADEPGQIYKSSNFYVTLVTEQNAKPSTTKHLITEGYSCAADDHHA